MKSYKELLFDVDGTLLDFDMAEEIGISAVLKAYGLEPSRENLDSYIQMNQKLWKRFEEGMLTKDELVNNRFHSYFAGFGLEVDGIQAEKLYRQYLNQGTFLIDGAMELCEYLKDRYDLYIVTNGVSITQYTRLKASGLAPFFKDIFVSEDARSQKPSIEFFQYCFERIPNAEPAKMLIIGDSLSSDIKGGNQSGIDTCWFNPKRLPGIPGIFADYEIQKLEELKKFL